ncbi:MAG: glycoside hydrolase family 16 protein [Melioribacteraceae bacterium]
MTRPILFLILFSLQISQTNCTSQVTDPPGKGDDSTSIAGWSLVWSEEFNYTGLPDSKKWGYDVAAPGWVNHEAQAYTDKRLENARVENGRLIIEARRDNYNNNPYSSARLVTKGKGDWIYGKFIIRAKLPTGKGTWPAIWMLPSVWNLGNGSWPDNGEIDIMEHVGYDQGVIHGSTHCNKYVWTNNTQKTGTIRIPDCSTAFHDYILEWSAEQIKVFVDDKLFFTVPNENKGWQYWPFYKNFHLILNLAIGGDWGGAQGIDNNIFPQRMEVEHVRVYKKVE